MVSQRVGSNIAAQGASYRKGLVLGLTMAEIMVLIVFILLLALAGIFSKIQEREKLMEREVYNSEEKVQYLTDLLEKYEQISNGKSVQDLARELVLAQRQLSVANAKNTELEAKNETSEALINDLKTLAEEMNFDPSPEAIIQALNELKTFKQVTASLGESGSFNEIQRALKQLTEFRELANNAGIDPTPQSVGRALEDAERIKKGLEGFGEKPIEEVIQEIKNVQMDNNNIKGQMANLKRKLDSVGKGTEMPSCWAKEDGTVEYIYDVALTSDGMKVRESDISNREEERKNLPVSQISLNQGMDSREFLTSTRPLFEWSKEKECRFFVRVYDLTKLDEKAIYKNRLRDVESHFYKLISTENY